MAKVMDAISEISRKWTMALVWLAFAPTCSHRALHLGELRYQIVSSPMERTRWQEPNFQPTVSKNLRPAISHVNEFGRPADSHLSAALPPVEPSEDCSPGQYFHL